MSSVGAYLRGLRQKQGMSIDELSRATRVLHHYLEALETDNIRALPAPVFTRGFIRAYCQTVGVAPDEALRIYDRLGVPVPDVGKVPAGAPRGAAVAEVARRPIVQEPDYLPVTPPGVPLQGQARQGRAARGTLLVSFILVVVLGAAFFAVTFTLQTGQEAGSAPSTRAPLPPAPVAAEPQPAAPAPGAAQVEMAAPPPPVATQLVKQAPQSPSAPAVSAPPAPSGPSASAPSAPPSTVAAPGVAPASKVAAAPPAAAVSTTLPTPAAPTAPVAPTPAAPPSTSAAVAAARGLAAPYRLIARTTETTWMRVRTEDGRTSEETIPANEIREWISNSPFIITIGNAGGVSLELNGRVLPRLGASGSVVTRLVLPSDTQ